MWQIYVQSVTVPVWQICVQSVTVPVWQIYVQSVTVPVWQIYVQSVTVPVWQIYVDCGLVGANTKLHPCITDLAYTRVLLTLLTPVYYWPGLHPCIAHVLLTSPTPMYYPCINDFAYTHVLRTLYKHNGSPETFSSHASIQIEKTRVRSLLFGASAFCLRSGNDVTTPVICNYSRSGKGNNSRNF